MTTLLLYFKAYSLNQLFLWITRMHSSRMLTARLLTVSQHALLGGCTCQGVYLSRGVYLPGGVPAQRGVYLGVPALGGCTCQGVYLPGGVPAGGRGTCQGVYLPKGVPARGCTCPGVPAQGVPAQVLPVPL